MHLPLHLLPGQPLLSLTLHPDTQAVRIWRLTLNSDGVTPHKSYVSHRCCLLLFVVIVVVVVHRRRGKINNNSRDSDHMHMSKSKLLIFDFLIFLIVLLLDTWPEKLAPYTIIITIIIIVIDLS